MPGWNGWYSLLIGAALKSTIVLAAAWLGSVALRKRSAAVRSFVWTAALASVLVLPPLMLVLPALQVPAEISARAGIVFRTFAAAAQHRDIPSSGKTLQFPRTSAPKSASDWRKWLVLLWAAGTALSLGRIAVSWIAVWRIRRSARPVVGADNAACARMVGMVRTPDVLEAHAGTMPASCGLIRAAVFLPVEAAGWSSQQRRMVLLHEFAHIHRGDPAAHLVARMALGFYWWNPLAWLAWREFLKERERAVDDVVLLTGAPATEYAGHLLEIARTMRSAPAVENMAVAMARRSQLEDRLTMILNAGTRRGRSHCRWTSIAALGIALLISPPFAALRAQDDAQVVPADVDATIRAAAAQKNHELLEGAASAAIAFQQYDLAQKLLESSLAIRAETAGRQSVDYGIGLIKLGDLERNRNKFDEAEAFYAKAVSVLGDRPEAAPALINLGTAALRTRKREGPQLAIDYFRRAQSADPSHAGVATMWLALVREQQGSPEEADALYRQALSLQDQKSAPAATTMELYARFLRQQGRTDEASAIAEQAAAVRKELGSHAPAIRQASAPNGMRVGAGVTAPTLAHKVEPQYTEEARQAKYQGTVIVSTVIGTDGTAQDMRVVRGLGLGLDEKALQAVSNWRFNPGMKDGQPVPVIATIEINFRLM